MKRTIVFFVIGLLLLAFLTTLPFITHRDGSKIKITNYVATVHPVENGAVIEEADVIQELTQMFPLNDSLTIDSVDVREIEGRLAENGLFEKVNVYYTMGGELHVEITPAEPLFMVVSDKKNYYVSKARKCISADNLGKYSQPLLVVYGAVNEELAQGAIFDLCNQILSDPYWRSFFTSLSIQSSGRTVVADTQYDHLSVNLGTMGDWKYKLWQLRTYIEKVVPVFGWSAFKQISVEYPDRITAIK